MTMQNNPPLNATACHSDGETPRAVVATVICCGQLALRIIGPSEFATSYHQRVIKHTTLFKMYHEHRRCLIGFFCLLTHLIWQIAMLILTLMAELNKTDIFFCQFTCHQTIGHIGIWTTGIFTIHLKHGIHHTYIILIRRNV